MDSVNGYKGLVHTASMTNSTQRSTATEGLGLISGKAFLTNIRSINSIYGLSFADSGNDIIAQITTFNVMRSYFAYGCNNHDIEITSTNAQSNDGLLVPSVVTTGTPTNALENIKLRYKVMGRTAGAAASYLTIGHAQNIANGILRNIDAEIDMDYTGEPGKGGLPPAVTFIKAGTASQNLLFEGIRIHGGIRNVPNSAGDLFKIFDTAQNPWSGETAKNVVIGPLVVSGSTTPTFQVNFHPFTDGNDNALTLRDIQFPGNSSWTNLGALSQTVTESHEHDSWSFDH